MSNTRTDEDILADWLTHILTPDPDPAILAALETEADHHGLNLTAAALHLHPIDTEWDDYLNGLTAAIKDVSWQPRDANGRWILVNGILKLIADLGEGWDKGNRVRTIDTQPGDGGGTKVHVTRLDAKMNPIGEPRWVDAKMFEVDKAKAYLGADGPDMNLPDNKAKDALNQLQDLGYKVDIDADGNIQVLDPSEFDDLDVSFDDADLPDLENAAGIAAEEVFGELDQNWEPSGGGMRTGVEKDVTIGGNKFGLYIEGGYSPKDNGEGYEGATVITARNANGDVVFKQSIAFEADTKSQASSDVLNDGMQLTMNALATSPDAPAMPDATDADTADTELPGSEKWTVPGSVTIEGLQDQTGLPITNTEFNGDVIDLMNDDGEVIAWMQGKNKDGTPTSWMNPVDHYVVTEGPYTGGEGGVPYDDVEVGDQIDIPGVGVGTVTGLDDNGDPDGAGSLYTIETDLGEIPVFEGDTFKITKPDTAGEQTSMFDEPEPGPYLPIGPAQVSQYAADLDVYGDDTAAKFDKVDELLGQMEDDDVNNLIGDLIYAIHQDTNGSLNKNLGTMLGRALKERDDRGLGDNSYVKQALIDTKPAAQAKAAKADVTMNTLLDFDILDGDQTIELAKTLEANPDLAQQYLGNIGEDDLMQIAATLETVWPEAKNNPDQVDAVSKLQLDILKEASLREIPNFAQQVVMEMANPAKPGGYEKGEKSVTDTFPIRGLDENSSASTYEEILSQAFGLDIDVYDTSDGWEVVNRDSGDTIGWVDENGAYVPGETAPKLGETPDEETLDVPVDPKPPVPGIPSWTDQQYYKGDTVSWNGAVYEAQSNMDTPTNPDDPSPYNAWQKVQDAAPESGDVDGTGNDGLMSTEGDLYKFGWEAMPDTMSAEIGWGDNVTLEDGVNFVTPDGQIVGKLSADYDTKQQIVTPYLPEYGASTKNAVTPTPPAKPTGDVMADNGAQVLGKYVVPAGTTSTADLPQEDLRLGDGSTWQKDQQVYHPGDDKVYTIHGPVKAGAVDGEANYGKIKVRDPDTNKLVTRTLASLQTPGEAPGTPQATPDTTEAPDVTPPTPTVDVTDAANWVTPSIIEGSYAQIDNGYWVTTDGAPLLLNKAVPEIGVSVNDPKTGQIGMIMAVDNAERTVDVLMPDGTTISRAMNAVTAVVA